MSGRASACHGAATICRGDRIVQAAKAHGYLRVTFPGRALKSRLHHAAAVTPTLPFASDKTDGWPFWSILIVDDEQGMRNFLVKTLVPRCHFVMEAGSAGEGAELLGGHHVDLIILDISLPGKSGSPG
jgi:PleD family two-component response regulator